MISKCVYEICLLTYAENYIEFTELLGLESVTLVIRITRSWWWKVCVS